MHRRQYKTGLDCRRVTRRLLDPPVLQCWSNLRSSVLLRPCTLCMLFSLPDSERYTAVVYSTNGTHPPRQYFSLTACINARRGFRLLTARLSLGSVRGAVCVKYCGACPCVSLRVDSEECGRLVNYASLRWGSLCCSTSG